jgi:hypothetical protein
MVEAIRKNPQGERLNPFNGFLPRLAIGKGARNLEDFGQPTSFLALDFNGQRQDGSSTYTESP